jgi:chromosomal replication initiation ATPase DnaA
MKEKAFDEYVAKVCDLFNLTPSELFKKSKRRDIVDARHLLYFLCYKRPMQIRYIQEYMGSNGYEVGHSTIIHGIETVKEKVTADNDYELTFNQLA